jgi:DNA-binding response OmpR family regulator
VAHILIVDDDKVVGETFARMLAIEGHRVTTVQNADAAFVAAGLDTPDALILDLRMPVVSGLDFLRQLRRDPRLRETPVAIVTGDYFLNEPVLAEMRSLGATVRYKPLWMDDLSALTHSLLDRTSS